LLQLSACDELVIITIYYILCYAILITWLALLKGVKRETVYTTTFNHMKGRLEMLDFVVDVVSGFTGNGPIDMVKPITAVVIPTLAMK